MRLILWSSYLLDFVLCIQILWEVGHQIYYLFWLPAACGGAALEANITVVLVLLLLMPFTQNLLLLLFSISITQY